MPKNMQILFVFNKQFLGRWKRYFKREYSTMDIDAIDFETLSVSDNQFLEEYSLVIICIEKNKDLFSYKLCKGNKNIANQIYLINITQKLFRRMVSCNKFLYEPGRLKESIDGLLNIMRSDSVVSLNCNDLLILASESELLCQGSEGIKEVVLFDAVVKWKTSKSLRSCLVNIVGAITLVDVSEICSLIQTYSDDSLLVGCRYEEKETISVFSLWKLMKKE
ncbi:hypothetical protein LJC58_01725 [Lachnospiraceae bacterium OttesenSCG-928-D06]|nr:hypothetical protein [Lachnospiraceae bacterium OttesenSCG-928-D06]